MQRLLLRYRHFLHFSEDEDEAAAEGGGESVLFGKSLNDSIKVELSQNLEADRRERRPSAILALAMELAHRFGAQS